MSAPFMQCIHKSSINVSTIRMPLDLEEEVSAATVTGDTVTGIYSNYSFRVA